jgi:hypothetical protein
VSIADVSSVTAPGDYDAYLPAEQLRSYRFTIGDDVYDIVGAAAMKALYVQRCNHDTAMPYVGDAGGPNYYYDAQYVIPNRNAPSYAYRDFSVGCDWDGQQCRAASWEITEPMAAYQGPFVFLVSFFMKGA